MSLRKFSIKTLSTCFYIGYLPFIPGTFASIAGIFLFYLIKGSIFIYILVTLVFIFLGLLVAGRAEKIFNQEDAKCISVLAGTGKLHHHEVGK